jgi:hypothetical protein
MSRGYALSRAVAHAQKFRQILRKAGIDLDNPSFLRGMRTTPGEFSNVHAKLTTKSFRQ